MENTGDSEDSIQHLKHDRHIIDEYKNGSASEVSIYFVINVPMYVLYTIKL